MWSGSRIDEYVYRYVGNCNIYYSSFILGSNFACVLCFNMLCLLFYAGGFTVWDSAWYSFAFV